MLPAILVDLFPRIAACFLVICKAVFKALKVGVVKLVVLVVKV